MPKPSQPVESLDFLEQDPAPVSSAAPAAGDASDLLPQAIADRLLMIDGVDGAWIERDTRGRRAVVLHVSRPGVTAGLPPKVMGLPTRIVGGEPIRAGM